MAIISHVVNSIIGNDIWSVEYMALSVINSAILYCTTEK